MHKRLACTGDCGLQFVRLLIVSLLAEWGLDLRITDCVSVVLCYAMLCYAVLSC